MRRETREKGETERKGLIIGGVNGASERRHCFVFFSTFVEWAQVVRVIVFSFLIIVLGTRCVLVLWDVDVLSSFYWSFLFIG